MAERSVLNRAEAVLALAGLALIGFSAFAWAAQQVLSERDLDRFHAARIQLAQANGEAAAEDRPARFRFPEDGLDAPDQRLWSAGRKAGYAQAAAAGPLLPSGIIRVPGLSLEVPILEGTDEWTLNRAAGRVPGTAQIGEPGNLAIAGHRDGFFRPLKDIAVGDAIEILTLSESYRYTVSDILIVAPHETSVLAQSGETVLTLITCYPFYFVGDAPQRYIVRAVLDSP